MRFSESLRTKYEAAREAALSHPFVLGLADGTLEEAKFRTWLGQDFLFHVECARVFSLAASRAPDMETMRWMCDMAHGALHNEILVHQAYAVEAGVRPEELAAVEKLPTTQAYTDHLIRTAGLGAHLDFAAAMLPMRARAEIGQALAKKSTPRLYGRWIDAYSSPTAARLLKAGRDLLDRWATGVAPDRLALAEQAFAISLRYEWMFWDMCWKGEGWPV